MPVQFVSNVPDQKVSFGTPFTLGIGDGAFFGNGLDMQLTAIHDSRCKVGVQCVWAGELSPAFWVRGDKAGTPAHDLVLGTLKNKEIVGPTYKYVLERATETTVTVVVTIVGPGADTEPD